MSSHLEFPSHPSIAISPSPSPAPNYDGTLIFGYGSNLWHHQLRLRCPEARYIGIARLRHWRWQINSAGHANVVEAPAEPHDEQMARWLGPLMADGDQDLRQDRLRTYGMVYEVNEEDLKKLDAFEDVGETYAKRRETVELWPRREGQKGKLNILRRGKRVEATFYYDPNNTEDSKDQAFSPYSYKLNQGILDAIEEGIPEGYINECIRPFVPNVEDSAVQAAIQAAVMRGVDVKRLVEKVEDQLAVTGIKDGRDVELSREGLQTYFNNVSGTVTPPGSDASRSNSPRRRALSSRW